MPRQTAAVASQYLDIKQLADQLGVNVATLYRMRAAKADLPPEVHIGTRVRWRQETVDAWAAAQEAKAAQGAA